MEYLFRSERLGFRRWISSDLDPFADMNKDPVVMEFFPRRLSTAETKGFLARIADHFRQHGFGWYAVDTLKDGQFIGFIGFMRPGFKADFTPCIEIGWRLKRESWNKGYATEGAKRCLEYGFGALGFTEVFSFTSKWNTRSERVMIKIGMEKVGEFEHPKIDPAHVLSRHVLYQIKNG